MGQVMNDAVMVAEKLALRAKLTLVPNSAWSDRDGYKTYLITLDGIEIGRVYNIRESNHRKAGRLICGTSYSKKWDYDMNGGHYKRSSGLYYSTRKQTVYELIVDLLRRDAIKLRKGNVASIVPRPFG